MDPARRGPLLSSFTPFALFALSRQVCFALSLAFALPPVRKGELAGGGELLSGGGLCFR